MASPAGLDYWPTPLDGIDATLELFAVGGCLGRAERAPTEAGNAPSVFDSQRALEVQLGAHFLRQPPVRRSSPSVTVIAKRNTGELLWRD